MQCLSVFILHDALYSAASPTVYPCACLPQVFFSVVMGAIQLGQSALHLSSFSEARGAAASIFSVIGQWSRRERSVVRGNGQMVRGSGQWSERDVIGQRERSVVGGSGQWSEREVNQMVPY